MEIEIKKLNKEAKIPSYAYKDDAGMDIFSIESFVLKPTERRVCKTGVAMKIPKGFVGLIWDKSGIALNGGIKTMGGVIENSYRGEIKIILKNLSNKDYQIKKGDKIAQMLIQKIENPILKEVDELDNTERGQGGFGSTGLR
ncbi:MAG TPA: dUTP diphosphatase [Candidatus Moranbacteria bacterium]|nr:dUTP diphosphatase [Candidatus Moranbacteria bacterium]